jgi:hypothetical protein
LKEEGKTEEALQQLIQALAQIEQPRAQTIVPIFGCVLIVFGDLGLVRYEAAQFHIV